MRHAKKLDKLLIENSKNKTAEPAKTADRNGDELHYYMQNFSKYRRLSKEETIQLVDRYRQGDLTARDALIFHNMRLVAVIALNYWKSGVPLSDRIQLGVIGLMASLEKFDPKRSNLATYATPRIRSEISRGIVAESTARPFYVPAQMVSRVRLVQRAVGTFWNEFGRNPSSEEIYYWIKTLVGTKDATKIAEEISVADVVLCHDLINHGQWRSLNAPMKKYDTESLTFADITLDPGDDSGENLEDHIEKSERVVMLDKLVSKRVITRQELKFLRLRADDKTLSEIGRKFNRSRERIRQREGALFNKIKKVLDIKPETGPDLPKQNKIERPLLKPRQPLNDQSIKSLFAGKIMCRPKTKNAFNRPKKIPPDK